VHALVNQKLAAANTDTFENILNVVKELNKVYWSSQLEMTKMPRAGMIRLPTAAARFSVIQNTHAGVKQSTDSGFVAIVGSCIRNLNHRAFLNLIGAEDSELDSYDWLNVRIRPNDSCRHSPLTLMGISIGGRS
jgi:hypothetical protein